MKIAKTSLALAGFAALAAPLAAQTTPTPGHDHHAAVNERGDHVMGFDHEKTTHHFRLTKSGGVIEVSANDPKDTDSRPPSRFQGMLMKPQATRRARA